MDIFFATATLSRDNLALLAPNGGDVWRVGKKRTITWASAGDPGTSVTLELLRNGNLSRVIAASTANDGLLRWNIPAGVAPGKGYAVRITSTTGAGITDTSDGMFKIKRAK